MKIFPCANKRPLTPNGFHDASDDPVQLDAWRAAYPDCQWGAPTGQVNGFVVLDVDNRNGGMESYESLLSKLPDTLRLQTPSGGYHLYFQSPDITTQNKQGLYPGIDFRGDGGYVITAPTPGYRPDNDHPVAKLPDWLLEAVRKRDTPSVPASSFDAPEGERGALNKRTLKFLLDGSSAGTWHQEFYQATMNLKQNGYTQEEATAKLLNITGHLDAHHDYPTIYDCYHNRDIAFPPDIVEKLDAMNGGVVKASELLPQTWAYLKDKAQVKGEPTGIEELDHMLGGGKRFGEVTVTLAEAKSGKNTLWHKLMYLWLMKKIPLGYASRELSPAEEVIPNLLSLHTQTNFWLADHYDQNLINEVVAGWPLYFADGYGVLEEPELLLWMDQLCELGVKYFWIDHLHYCLADPEEFKSISKFVRRLKTYAKAHQVHIDIIVQPKIQETGTHLSLASLRGGASIGQALDNLITMTRERDEEGTLMDVVRVQLTVARSKLARLGKVYLAYNRETTDFTVVVEAKRELALKDLVELPGRNGIQSRMKPLTKNADLS